jgi:acetate kinase
MAINHSKKILVINAGSSSIKFKLFYAKNLDVIASGLCERIFIDGYFKVKYGNNQLSEANVAMPNHTKAIEYMLNQLLKLGIVTNLKEIIGVGHRVVQGGEFNKSVVINKVVKQRVKELIPLAPLHNEPELAVIEVFEKFLPHAKSIASFDTTFHTTMPPISYTYPIDQKIAQQHQVRRYGYHGNSYRYITQYMTKLLRKTPNLIICHLGNGASVCGVRHGKSYITSMGLTPLEGLIMGTRCGDIDPSIILYLIRQGLKPNTIDDILNKQSGVKGLSGLTDMRDVEAQCAKHNQHAKFTIDLYATKVAEYIVRYANILENKVDAIVFTAGVGENSM